MLLWLGSLEDADWGEVVWKYADAYQWPPSVTLEQPICTLLIAFGQERENADGSMREARPQSPSEQLSIINAARKRKGLPPLRG